MAAAKKKSGRPALKFTREQTDRAKDLLGEVVFGSRAADRLRTENGLSRHAAYKLIEQAQAEVYDAIRGTDGADDPLTCQYLLLLSIQANPSVSPRVKVAAAMAVIKLLGLHKLAEALGDAGVDEFIGRLANLQKAKQDSQGG